MNCLLGNFFNLMETLGHKDTKLHEAVENHLISNMKAIQNVTGDMAPIQEACRKIGYNIINLPKLNYEKLTHWVKSLCLPMLVSLSILSML